MGKRRLKLPVPLFLMAPLVRSTGWLMKTPPVTSEQLRMLRYDNVAKPGVVEAEFRFKPWPLHGNIGFVRMVSYWDAVRIMSGRMPRHIRDH